MKLALLGIVAAGIGLALSEPGLIGIGAYWAALGPLMRKHGERVDKSKDAARQGRTMAIGTALWVALGAPSLLVGILPFGIGVEHNGWRWLPLIVGALALGIGVISGVLYLTGSAIEAVADNTPSATIPATIWIRATRETGTFINDRPRLEFDLRVEPDVGSGAGSYEVTKKATVPITAIALLRVGDGFQAMVAGPDAPTVMDIRWDAPVRAGAGQDVSTRLAELDRLHHDAKITDAEYQAQRDRILGSL